MTMTCRMLQVTLFSLTLPPSLSQQMMMPAILYEDLPHAASGRQRQRQRQRELEDSTLSEFCTQEAGKLKKKSCCNPTCSRIWHAGWILKMACCAHNLRCNPKLPTTHCLTLCRESSSVPHFTCQKKKMRQVGTLEIYKPAVGTA
jgi:hypothetical protein